MTGKFISAITLLLLFSTPARAFLGADSGSLAIVKTLIAAKSEKVTQYSSHTVHEYAVLRGSIRAYVAPDGSVFAYSGRNIMGLPPSALFGPYLKEYRDAVRQAHLNHGRRPLSIRTEHIRAKISGPQGALNWSLVLNRLPAGVSSDEIH